MTAPSRRPSAPPRRTRSRACCSTRARRSRSGWPERGDDARRDLASLHRRGIAPPSPPGGTAASVDASPASPTPLPVWRGQSGVRGVDVATASFPSSEIATLDFPTRFGPILLRRADGDGELEIIGPSTVTQLANAAGALEAAGADVVLLDGAIGRRAFACGRLADGIVLAVGMAAGESLDAVLAATRGALELIRLGPAPAGAESALWTAR